MTADPAHPESALRLADYARRRLDPAGQAEVAAHLPGCAECRGMLEAYALMESASAEAAGATSAHLTGAAIAALAVQGSASRPAPDVARHLDACRDCAGDLRLARAANDSAASPRHGIAGLQGSAPGPSPVTRWLLPLAAVLAIALLGLAMASAWRQSDALARKIASLENDNAALQSKVVDLSRVVAGNRATADTPGGEAARDADGAVSYLFLRGTVRGASGVERLTLEPGQQAVYLALAVEIPAAARHRGEDGRVTLVGADGRERWTSPIPGGELDRLAARGDSLLLRVPAAVLGPGRQEIRLTPATPAAGAPTWFRSAFEISGGRSR